MQIIKHYVIFLLSFILLLGGISYAKEIPTIYFFYGKGCPHCSKEETFLENLQKNEKTLNIQSYEVWNNTENAQLLSRIGQKLKITRFGVPMTIIGEQVIIGFQNEKTTGQEILEAFSYCKNNPCKDIIAIEQDKNNGEIEKNSTKKINYNIDIPFFGTLDLKSLSLPVITIIMGLLDGFNPCAMRILLFLISMLLGTKNLKRMRILGGTFIFISATVYFLFMTAWLNIIEFLGFLVQLRIGIGIFAGVAGGYNMYQYRKSRSSSGCTVVSKEKRQKIFERITTLVKEKNLWIALLGISVLAISVNLIELLCSAGLPVVFTQILEVNHLNTFLKYFYISIYIFFFMIDDLFVFTVSMKTLQLTGITTKYTKYTHIIGGILMLFIGFCLIFKPQRIMFG